MEEGEGHGYNSNNNKNGGENDENADTLVIEYLRLRGLDAQANEIALLLHSPQAHPFGDETIQNDGNIINSTNGGREIPSLTLEKHNNNSSSRADMFDSFSSLTPEEMKMLAEHARAYKPNANDDDVGSERLVSTPSPTVPVLSYETAYYSPKSSIVSRSSSAASTVLFSNLPTPSDRVRRDPYSRGLTVKQSASRPTTVSSSSAAAPAGTVLGRPAGGTTTPNEDLIHLPGAFAIRGADRAGESMSVIGEDSFQIGDGPLFTPSSLEDSMPNRGQPGRQQAQSGQGGSTRATGTPTNDGARGNHEASLSSLWNMSLNGFARRPVAALVVEEENETGVPVAALPVDMELEEKQRHALKSRFRLRLVVAALLTSVLALTLGITLGNNNNNNNNNNRSTAVLQTSAPSLSPSSSPTLSFTSRLEVLRRIASTVSNESLLALSTSPQTSALEWLAQDNVTLSLNQDWRILQRYILAVLFYATNGPNWTQPYGFLSDQHECLWIPIGETCNAIGEITEVDLSWNRLVGNVPQELYGLNRILRLALRGNRLTGRIPSVGMENLTDMRAYDFGDNLLFGTLPSALFLLTNLELLRLDTNEFYGTLATDIGRLSKLTKLDIDINFLRGTIPTEMFGLTNMQHVELHHNRFTGTIATEYGLLGSMTSLAIYSNSLNGTIPSELGRLTMLTNLALSDQHLTGTLPSELGNLGQLSRLSVSYNSLSGNLPTTLARLSSLRSLYLQGNNFVGDLGFLCNGGSEGRLDPFRADLRQVNCSCCDCCDF